MSQDGLGLDAGTSDLLVLHDGRTMQTHGPDVCFGPYCCIHNPSDHPLNTAPLTWLAEMALMFRVCKHGAVHPDPDALRFHMLMALIGRAVPYDGYHPCCDEHCCHEASVTD